MGWVYGHAPGAMQIENGVVEQLAPLANPSFLAAHPNLPVVYAVTELPYGMVTAISLERGGDRRISQQSVATGGGGPCHLAVSNDSNHLLVANTRSSIAAFELRADGSIGAVTSVVHPPGPASGTVMPRQEMPHPHMIAIDPVTGDVLVPDLGMDAILVYGFFAGELQLRTVVSFPPGSGPRHLAFHPAGTHAYVVEELADAVATVRRGPGGEWERLGAVPAAGPGSSSEGAASSVAVSARGDHFFVADRGANVIALFITVDPGAPEFVGSFDCGGVTPRDLALTSDGQTLFVANQDSDAVAVFDLSAGRPRLTTVYSVPSPACVLPVPGTSHPVSRSQKSSKFSRK